MTNVEITPEMIKAGVGALCAYDSEFESREEGVTHIYRSMTEARLRNSEELAPVANAPQRAEQR